MLKFCSLYSGSSGNSLFVQTDKTKIIIDAGVSCKKIVNSLEELDINPSSIDGILVTHEHTDHVQSLATLSNKFQLPVFVNKQTLDAMPKQKDKLNMDNIHIFKSFDAFEINDLKIKPFKIPHDAANPCGFNIYADNKKISIATDMGHISKEVMKHLEDSIFVLLESNYDPEVLMCAPYPYSLKTRIASPTGHLPNEIAGETISHLLNSGLKQAVLGHLSKNSNMPELAYSTVIEKLNENNCNLDNFGLSVANRDCPSKIISI